MKKLFLFLVCLVGFLFAEVNINTATKEELMTLPGIGNATAEAIIEYRKENKFNEIDDIKNVKGIGDAKFEKIKAQISVSGNTKIDEKTSKKETKKSKKSDKENDE